jgi:pimeloyl-ACP methyl ester carboxylesterase
LPYAESDGARIHYEIAGAGGETVVLLPGLGMATPAWQPVRDRLAGSARVVVVDPRGAGESDKPDAAYTGEVVARDVVAVLDAAGAERAHLVGHSMGGMIAQETAIRHPSRVASLVLAATYAALDDWSRRVMEVRRTLIERLGLREQFRMSVLFVFSPRAFRTMGDFIGGLEQRLAEHPPDERAYLRQLDFCMQHDARTALGAIAAPTLVVSGGEDILTSALQGRELAELIPGAGYAELPEASHGLVWEDVAGFSDLVRDFIAGASTSGQPAGLRTGGA